MLTASTLVTVLMVKNIKESHGNVFN